MTEDFILEGNETLTVSIVDYGGALMGPITSATITIEDNDGEKTLCSMHTRIPHCSDFTFDMASKTPKLSLMMYC